MYEGIFDMSWVIFDLDLDVIIRHVIAIFQGYLVVIWFGKKDDLRQTQCRDQKPH